MGFDDPEKHPPCFYIEMPFYAQGQIDQWIRENAKERKQKEKDLQEAKRKHKELVE